MRKNRRRFIICVPICEHLASHGASIHARSKLRAPGTPYSRKRIGRLTVWMRMWVEWVASPSTRDLVGPVRIRNQRKINDAGSPDPDVPAIKQGREIEPSGERHESCRYEFPGCDREFLTKTGRGVHCVRTHKRWYDGRQNIHGRKARWTEEEDSLLARREAELTVAGGVTPANINQELFRHVEGRTFDAMKIIRKM